MDGGPVAHECMSRRGWTAVGVVVLWAGGLAALVRQQYFQPNVERLAEAGSRVTPAGVFYAVLRGGRQVGFASSTVDTVVGGITATDYLLADVPDGRRVRRIQARTTVATSRALHLRTFEVDVQSDSAPFHAGGRVEGDSVVVYAVSTGPGAAADSQRLRIDGPVLLPTLVPLAVALGEDPKVGGSYLLPVFEIDGRVSQDTRVSVSAETTFVVNDSSVLDSTTGRWRGVQPDTLRAWRLQAPGTTGLGGWIDHQGRVVEATRMGLELIRRPYAVAYQNWRMTTADDGSGDPESEIQQTTVLAARVRVTRQLARLQVRLRNLDLAEFALNGGDQTLHGDTLTVVRPQLAGLRAPYFPRPLSADIRRALGPSPHVESASGKIHILAGRIHGHERNAVVLARLINRWVHDSLRLRVTSGTPDALQTLRTHAGDCNEHTQLYLAIARAMGLPARAAAGLAYVNGKFYYDAWPEVYLGQWIPVDPTLGQFPADASHLRFTTGSLGVVMQLMSRLSTLHIDVLHADAGT